MAIKNILAALGPGRTNDAGAKYAVSMGAKLQAHVTGRVYAIEPELRGVYWLPEGLIENSRASLIKEAKDAAKKFSETAGRSKLHFSSEVLTAALGDAARAFSEAARVNDISIVTQSRPGLEYIGDVFMEAALFSSGRPVIVVPHKHSKAFSAERVLIAWDGSAQAARAVALSMPILAGAREIRIIVVGDRAKVQASRAKALGTSLERHGFDIGLVTKDHNDDAGTIAREAKNWGASLLVMGGYGRSKLREVVFGGVTRYMLIKAPLPVLMGH